VRNKLIASWLVGAAVVAGLALMNPASEPADGAPRFSIHSQTGLLWRSVDGQRLEADFYWPSTGCPCPAIVEFHGGGFNTGSRSWNTDIAKAFAYRGFFVMNTDYRTTGSAYLAMDDAEAAVGYLKTRPEVDPARIGAHGTSAGGVLATGLALEGSDVGVVGAVAWSGGTDRPKVTKHSAPLLLAHALDDQNVPFSDSQAVYDAYVGAGRTAWLDAMPGGAHGLALDHDNRLDLFTVRWLNLYVKGSVDPG
jgi:dipeptidyl aminopeptidase/acylaminoacyl peptidase